MQYIRRFLVTASELLPVDCHVWCFRTICYISMSVFSFYFFCCYLTNKVAYNNADVKELCCVLFKGFCVMV